jgi:hypothetical protein
MARTVIKLRRDESDNWQSVNPVLSLGEPGFETDTKRLKIGDGSSVWNDLDYVAGSGGVGAAVIEEDIEDTVAALMISGTGVVLSYNDGADSLTVNSIPYIAGTGISISSYTINNTYTAGEGISITDNTISVSSLESFQDTYSGTLSGTINNWDPIVEANTVRVSGANGVITGLLSTYQLSTLFINVGSNNITLKHNNASSDASNRFSIPWGGDYTITPSGGGALIVRDLTNDIWRVV